MTRIKHVSPRPRVPTRGCVACAGLGRYVQICCVCLRENRAPRNVTGCRPQGIAPTHTMAREGDRVYIGNLNPDAQKEDVEKLFAKYGTVTNVWVARRPPGACHWTYYALYAWLCSGAAVTAIWACTAMC